MDDDRMVRALMDACLRSLGYEVVVAADGPAAVNVFRHSRETGQPIDGVILDLAVPSGCGGEWTMPRLRELDPSVRAAVCSGNIEKPAAYYAGLGFLDVLEKPFTTDRLRLLVERLVVSPAAV